MEQLDWIVSNALVRSNEDHVYLTMLFATFLLNLLRSEDHVGCSTAPTKAALTLRENVLDEDMFK